MYPSFFPIKGGSSVHGYYLAKELNNLGYKLITFNQQDEGSFINYPYNLFNVLKAIVKADIVYLRISPTGKSIYLPFLISLFNKKFVIELNGPNDEYLITKNFSLKQVEKLDKKLSKALKFADAVITVSDEMKEYIEEYLHCKKVYVVSNGGSPVAQSEIANENTDLKQTIDSFTGKFPKIALWSGTDYPWHNFKLISELIEQEPNQIGYIIISPKNVFDKYFSHFNNVLHLENIDRKYIEYIIQKSHIGIALYGTYEWARFKKYYNSSLKYYEYIANGLGVLASPYGHMLREKHPNAFLSENATEMIQFIENYKKSTPENFRSWKDVAIETDIILKST